MIRKPTVVSALCLAWFLAGNEAAPLRAGSGVCGSLQLANDGKTEYVIVTATAASRAEAFAARELAEYLGRGTKTSWPVVKECDFRGDKPALFVGPAEFARQQGIDVGKLGSEEWIIRSVDSNVVISGGRPRGTLYGAYEFLERCVGVRFLDAATEYVPQRPTLTLPADMAIQSKPAFFRREIFMVTPHQPRQVLFQVRRKINAFGNAAVAAAGPELGFCTLFGSPYSTHTHHLYTRDFPTDKPEYFALTEQGHRTGPGPDGQVCMSHPDVRKLFASRLRRYIREDRERIAQAGTDAPPPLIYDLTPNDNLNKCVCDRCRALAVKYGAYSGVVLEFTNAVADEIAKDYPEVLVQTAAYTFYLEAPRGITPRDNVLIRIAQLGAEFSVAPPRDTLRSLVHPVNVAVCEAFESRAGVSKTLGVHDYWTAWNQQFQWPHADIRGLAPTLRFYHRSGVRDYFVEDELMGSRLHNFVDLQFYLASRLLQNPAQDEQPIIAEFMELYYRSAAPLMRQLLDYIERRQEEESGILATVPPATRRYFDARFFVETDALLRRAEEAVAGDAEALAHVRQERLPLDETILYLWNELNRGGELPFRRADLVDRLQKSYAAAYEKYGGWGSEKADAQRLDYLRNLPPVPPQFADKKILDLCGPQLDLRQAGGGIAQRVDDPDATCGQAWRLDATLSGPPGQHDKPLEFGLYDDRSKELIKKTMTPAEIPHDEKYHFYSAGRIKGSPNLHFWAHHSWRLAQRLNVTHNSTRPEQATYEVYLSLKLEGPAYVPRSTKPNACSIDRLILVEVPGP